MNYDRKICGECGSQNSKRTTESYAYPYGIKDDQIELTSIIPVHTCDNCNFSWFDFEAENIIDKDIEEYIKNNQDI